ncbi:MAG: ribose-5-phosphate isomerase RpiA [Treponema sp.]|jgi:ribose 5-phosphate isomerase A|nr:ribose-5-phosphate isomerase RpiA [Treponema sp.]
MDQETMKENAGKAAVDALVRSGMKLGLGSGSTAMTAVRYIGGLMKQGALKDIKAIATSFQTELECEKWRIPLYSLSSSEINGGLDLTIDGADQIDRDHFCVKGGGGALLLEKIAAYSSKAYAIALDETKVVDMLGVTFPVAIEILPKARVFVCAELAKLGAECILREAARKAGPVVTDNGNFLVDITFKNAHGRIYPALLEEQINHIPGVIENGFFTRKGPHVFVARADGAVDVWD